MDNIFCKYAQYMLKQKGITFTHELLGGHFKLVQVLKEMGNTCVPPGSEGV